MALNTNPFIEGINPTATFGGYASVLLQLIRQAIPSSTYGMVLFDTTAPDVTGSNAWRKTCIWLNLTLPNTPTVNVYKEGTSPGWVNTNVIIADNSISTSMIKNYDPATLNTGVTLPKLSPAGGAALQLIRVNATATNFEFVSLASLVTVGSIPVGSLITTGIPPGQLRFAGVFGPTTAQWLQPIQIINALVDGSINPDLIAPPGALTSRSQFLTARTADTFATYRYFEPNTDMLNATMNGSKLQDATVGPEKIYSAGVPDGYLMGKVAGVPDWVAPLTITGATTKFVNTVAETITQAVPTAYGAGTSIPHTLGQIPTTYRVAFYCQTAEFEYIQGDEIEILGLYRANGFADDDQTTAYNIRITSSAVIVQVQVAEWAIHAVSKTTGTFAAALTPGNWRLRLYATYTS
jgi:hypothetical protein